MVKWIVGIIVGALSSILGSILAGPADSVAMRWFDTHSVSVPIVIEALAIFLTVFAAWMTWQSGVMLRREIAVRAIEAKVVDFPARDAALTERERAVAKLEQDTSWTRIRNGLDDATLKLRRMEKAAADKGYIFVPDSKHGGEYDMVHNIVTLTPPG